MRFAAFSLAFLLVTALVACGSNSTPRDGAAASPLGPSLGRHGCNGREGGEAPAQPLPAPNLQVPTGFAIETIGSIGGARELAALPNGDLIVGTEGSDVYIVPSAEGKAGAPRVFATINDNQAAGVYFARTECTIYVASTNHVWAIPYNGERKARTVKKIADVRTGPIAPGTDGDVHTTTSVAYSNGLVYAAAGSSCNATVDHGSKPCVEVDPTRAAVSVMNSDGSNFNQRAKRIRNAIAVTVNPDTGSVWVGGAGQDNLPKGHPYEYLDNLSAHPGDADYGWPVCEENHHAYWKGYDCGLTVKPLVELPAYSTIIGATFYPANGGAAFSFPVKYRGGLFAAAHGSWHTNGQGCNVDSPHVVFVDMNGDKPVKHVNWNDPTTQWREFVTGFQTGCNGRSGRPTGIAVGPKGSLFIGDDQAGLIYRVRPTH